VDVKVKVTREGIYIPEELVKEMMSAYVKMEQVLATRANQHLKHTLNFQKNL
jgi:hypothetical protein